MTTIARAASVTATALLALVAALAVVLAFFGGHLAALAIERGGSALVGRAVKVGPVTVDWGRYTTVTAQELRVADLAWSPAAQMLRIGRSDITFDLWDLLRLQLMPDRVRLRQPVLHLARNQQGQWNLPQAQKDGSPASGKAGHDLLARLAALQAVEVTGGQLSVDSLASPGTEGEVRAFALHMQEENGGTDFRGMASLRGGAPVPFTGRTGSPDALLRSIRTDGTPFPVQVKLGPETARLSADGHLGNPLDLASADLRLRGDGDSLAPLLGAIGLPAEPTPPFHLTAHATGDGQGWNLRDMLARLGSSELRGSASLVRNAQPRPRLSFDLIAPRIALADFEWLVATPGAGGVASSAPQPARMPAAWLRQADASGTLQVQQLEGLPGEPAALRMTANLQDGRLHIEPLRLEIAGGMAEGATTIAADEAGSVQSSLRLEASGLSLAPVLAPLGIEWLTGSFATASLDLRSQGATRPEILAGLGGRANFRVSEGSLDLSGLPHISMDLVETLGFLLGSGGGSGPTPVVCAVADLPIRHGVVQVEQLVVQIPQVVIVGEGTVQLAQSRLNLTLTPNPLQDALLRVLVPVVVSGDLASPGVTRHPELSLQTKAAAQAKACAP
ncbi:AsmA family protein [Roseomonas sp. E05]|uniref:AsmA family protein n=1 Tax=Roseomonas sp. E05 TaxID=3046310 RepID=UPI0024BA358C|nr:AsmA family protein [Roseomonas sp. E05]MDJ0387234.1 AsmA family protein [Roseomonas sp. E05]